jgi:hypothetical protein
VPLDLPSRPQTARYLPRDNSNQDSAHNVSLTSSSTVHPSSTTAGIGSISTLAPQESETTLSSTIQTSVQNTGLPSPLASVDTRWPATIPPAAQLTTNYPHKTPNPTQPEPTQNATIIPKMAKDESNFIAWLTTPTQQTPTLLAAPDKQHPTSSPSSGTYVPSKPPPNTTKPSPPSLLPPPQLIATSPFENRNP